MAVAQHDLQAGVERLEALGAALAAAGARQSAWAPFLLGCFVATTVLLLLTGLAAAAAYSWWASDRHRRRLTEAADLAGARNSTLRKVLGEVLPAWATAPDAARVEWMNTLNAQLWPHIEAAASKLLLKDDLLENLLNGSTFWRPSILMGAHIELQAVQLGSEPPRITGAKCFRQHTTRVDEVLLEFSFAWASKMEVKLLVTLLGGQRERTNPLRTVLSSVSRVKVGVSDLVAKGTLRIALKPLLDDLPVAGGFKVSLMGTPEFHYRVSTLGGNPYLLPGVEALVASFIRENVLKPFTFPDGFSYDLVTGQMGQAFEKPQGLLEVTVVGAANVPRMDWYGKADPYCKLWLRDNRKLRTAVARRTLNPHWDEKFTFIVHSTALQELTLTVWDSDRLSADDLAGVATLPLSTLDLTPGETRDHWVPLARSSDGAKRGAAATGAPGANTTEFSGQRQRVVHMPGTPAPAASPAAQPSGSGLDPGSSNWSTATGPFSSDSAATLAGQRSSAAAEAAAAEPPSTPGQPPPQQQRRGSATDDEPGLTPAGSPGDAAALQVAQEQQEAAEQEAAERAAAERAAAAALAGAASGTAAATPPRQGWRTRRKKGAAAAPPATPELPARLPSMLSGAAPTLASIPTAFEALAHDFARLAANPLDALRAKQCQLHIRTCYMPLTEAEKEAMVKEASRQRRGGRGLSHAPTAPAGQGPGRVKTLLFSGVLYVYLDHAQSLGGSQVKGFTRNFEARVRVGDLEKRTEHGQVPFRHRSNPVFDETLELIVDGATALKDCQVQIELWVLHLVRKPTFKGRVTVPLQEVIERKRWRDTWPLEDAAQGTLTMELSWMGALAV